MQRGLRRLAQQRTAPLLWSFHSYRPSSSFALCCPSLFLRRTATALARAAAARASTRIAVRTAATTAATAPQGDKHLPAGIGAGRSTTAHAAGRSYPDSTADAAPAGSSSNNHNSNTSSTSSKAGDLGETSSSSLDSVSSSSSGEVSSSNKSSIENSGSDNSSAENSSSNNSSGRENSSKDDTGSWWSFRWTWPRGIAAAFATSAAVWFGYEYVESGFSLGKTEWTMTRKIKRFFLGKPLPSGAAVDSKFQLGLPEELQDELAVYFIQLDLDKPNGVRRSDALALAETLGFDTKNKICGAFVQKGKGRGIDERRTAGCSLQELGELIEALVLHEEANPNGQEHQPQQQQDEQLQQGRLQEGGDKVQQEQRSKAEKLLEQTTKDAPAFESEGLQAGAPSSSSLSREKPQERVLRLLKEANEQAKPTAWTAPRVSVRHLSQAMAHQQQQQQQQEQSSSLLSVEQNQEEERRALGLRLAVIERTLSDLNALSKRRGRTEAERERQKDLESERKMIEAQLREFEYS